MMKMNLKELRLEKKEIDDYIENLAKTNNTLAKIMNDLWFQIKMDPEKLEISKLMNCCKK